MNENQTGVTMEQDSVLAAATLTDTAETPSEPMSSLAEAPESAQQEPQGQQTSEQKEPGYVKRRVKEAEDRVRREMQDMMEQEFQRRLAPLYESVYDRQADELVKQGAITDKAMALELVKLRTAQNGFQPVTPATTNTQSETPQRDAQGRFVARQEQPQQDPHIQELADQAILVRDRYGLDVMGAYQNNPEYQTKVLKGEMNFYDIAMEMQQGQTPKRTPPAPMRNANGASGTASFDVAHMSDEQFNRLQQALASGKTFDPNK